MIEFIQKIAQDAGKTALNYFNDLIPNEVHSKGHAKDLVSTADRAVEQKIIGAIQSKFPDHSIFGEETGKSNTGSEYCWIIDPIDGTQSFVRKHPYFSISIALTRNRIPVAGVVFAPALGLLFSAEAGKGAFENGNPIHVSGCTEIREACCSTGFACIRAELKQNNLGVFSRLVPVIHDIKRCGSAALDCCFTASGRYDAYWELALQPYDVAAGALIAAEAGATVCDLTGGAEFPEKGILLCATESLRSQFMPYFEDFKF